MSFKTDRLTALFPDAYVARESASLLYRLLDAVGLEFTKGDESVKALLKSHWVDHAQDGALDGLGATFGIERRRLPDGTVEADDAFRRRLKSVVPYFTGGGTVKAVAGAVRSALGLPFDLELFRRENTGPQADPAVDATATAIEGLVQVEEFSPEPESVLSDPVARVADTSQVTVEVSFPTVVHVYPRIEWKFTNGGRRLTLERLDSGEGIKSSDALIVPPGGTLVLTASSGGALSASIGLTDVTNQFTALKGSSAPILPALPGETTYWKFTAKAGGFDLSVFDDVDGFDSPDFSVRIQWTRYQPLTFDVIVPYYVNKAVEDIRKRTGFLGQLFLFEGLPLEVIQTVVDQTRAAGVKGMVHFSLNFSEDHAVEECQVGLLEHRHVEMHHVDEDLNVGSLSTALEHQDMEEAFALGGVFNISTFDSDFGFQ